jgi:hypothetical protein
MVKFISFYKKITKNKFIELEVMWVKHWNWLSFLLEITRRQDHPGLHFEFEILGFVIDFCFRDSRHWDYDNDCYTQHLGEK